MSVPDLIAQRYRLVAQVGAGGMGLVYKAIDTRLDRAVAIKAINRAKLERPGTADRLRDEAMAAASLDHPFICRIYELIDEGDDTYIVMEFVEGETLSTMMKRGRLPLTETVRLFSEIAEGLANAHARGLVHRDIKPANVMVTPHGHVKLLDFGIAQPDVSSAPEANTKTSPEGPMGGGGTPQYMSPEQATGAPVTARADLFSLGVALYECLAGRLPFEGTTDYDYVHHLIASTPKPLHKLAPDAPDDLVQLVEQCLERTPAHRPASAAFVASELRRIGGHLTSPTGVLESAKGVRRRRRRVLIGIATFIAAAGIALFVWQWMQPRWGPIGRNRPVTTSPGREFGSRISPDGKWILFLASVGEKRQVFVQQIDALVPQPVTLPAALYEGCVWSPDQSKLGCLGSQGDQLTLQIVPAFGGAVIQSIPLQGSGGSVGLLRWIESSIYVWVRARDRASASRLQRIDLRTNERIDLAGPWTSMKNIELDVRPDGREVVMSVGVPGSSERRDLMLAEIGATKAKQFTPQSDSSMKTLPVWSANGRTVVYQSNRGGQTDLWEIDRRTGAQRQLTSSPAIEIPESVGADGSVSFQLIDESAALWSWSTNTVGAGQPLNEDSLSAFAPTLSSDGLVVAFQRSLPSPREGFLVMDSMLVLAGVDGQRLHGLQSDKAGFLPRLSPDGSWIAYQQRASIQSARISIMRRATGETFPLSDVGMFGALNLSFPVTWTDSPMVWGPKSDEFYFVEKQDSNFRLRRERVREGLNGLSTLVTRTDRIIDVQVSGDGRYLAYLTIRSARADQNAGGASAYALHVFDLQAKSNGDRIWASFAAGDKLSCRGWTPDSRSVVMARLLKVHDEDKTHQVALMLLSTTGQTPLITTDRVVPGTIRVSPFRPVIYLTRSDDAVANIYGYSLESRTLRPVTDNSQIDVTFGNVEPLGKDRVVGVRDVRRHDIWLLDARSNSPGNPASGSR